MLARRNNQRTLRKGEERERKKDLSSVKERERRKEREGYRRILEGFGSSLSLIGGK